MATSPKFFKYPFGFDGDKATVPDSSDDGTVNYVDGWGPDYQIDPNVDPKGKLIPRPETNQIAYDITENVQYFQLYGAPQWYAADDTGTPVQYSRGSRVRYQNGTTWGIYVSLKDQNEDAPTVTDSWTDSTIPVASTRAINTGQGLTGGGNLTADRNIRFTDAVVSSLNNQEGYGFPVWSETTLFGSPLTYSKGSVVRGSDGLIYQSLRDNNTDPITVIESWQEITLGGESGDFVPTTRKVTAGTGLSGGGELTEDVTLELSADVQEQLNTFVPETTKINTAAALSGGGDLSADRTIDLSQSTKDSITKANTAVQPGRTISAGWGLTGGGDLSANRTIEFNQNSKDSLTKADNSIQRNQITAMIARFAVLETVNGWLPCDGAAVSRTDYSALFAAIGTNYGEGDGETTFNVPNITRSQEDTDNKFFYFIKT